MDTLQLYEKLIATHPEVERKGATMAYTSRNGHMFSFLTKEGSLALRLSDDDRAAFVQRYKTSPVVQYGAVMREYVAVPDALLARTAEIKRYFTQSFEYVGSLKPKATTRKASATTSRVKSAPSAKQSPAKPAEAKKAPATAKPAARAKPAPAKQAPAKKAPRGRAGP